MNTTNILCSWCSYVKKRDQELPNHIMSKIFLSDLGILYAMQAQGYQSINLTEAISVGNY